MPLSDSDLKISQDIYALITKNASAEIIENRTLKLLCLVVESLHNQGALGRHEINLALADMGL